LANRLTEDPNIKVLLLEAGGRDSNPWIHVPAGFYRTIFNPKFTWGYETLPVEGLQGRRMVWPRGKVLGGSSSINGLIYIRGSAYDFALWRQQGNVGWSYEDVLPFFLKIENNDGGADDYRGVGGPLSVSGLKMEHQLHTAFINAALEAGHPRCPDFNGRVQEGVGSYQLSIKRRRRSSTATAYLTPAAKRPNLRIETNALVQRLLFENRRAAGVEYRQKGRVVCARASGEVLLSGGAINSPQLLQISGIGPADLLRQYDIDVICDLPGVGANLQDHLAARVVTRCAGTVTLNEISRNPIRQVHAAFQYMSRGTGALMMGAGPLGMLARSSPDVDWPDLQFFFVAGSREKAGPQMHPFPGCSIVFHQCRPESRGWVRINSPDPSVHPSIQPNYLSSFKDVHCLAAGVGMARRLFEMPSLKRYVVDEYLPGRTITTEEQLTSFIRQNAATGYHPAGTCKMGIGETAVVDSRLRVYGVQGLRVVDASVMPTIVSTNTNATAIMIGEKGADMVLQDRRAEPSVS
jgi:choline dehydrogenase